ncbi:MAG: LPS export ABC transporter periplasmic protein LptC [Spirochaetia bacterium]|nr:LPS export ABC transporter periplasmic protein LptC [Spirochaetia bacterium]
MTTVKSPGRALSLAAALFAALSLFFSCSLGEESPLAAQEELPEVVFFNYSRKDFGKTGLSFIAQAERAEYFKEKGLLVVYGLSFEDIGDDGVTVVASGEAEEAYYYEDTGDAEVKGSVRIRSLEEDASFETDSLKYFAATESLEGGPENPVLVRIGETLFLQGRGFFADVREKAFAFRGGVEGMIQSKAVPARTKE